MTTLLFAAGLVIGSFATPAQACIPPSDALTSPEYISRQRRTLTERVSRRSLRENVRRGWKN